MDYLTLPTISWYHTYDTWGKVLAVTGSMTDTLGKRNPIRYRGYFYDEDTGLYYLKSRYYNPEWKRFINADVFLGTHGTLLSHNLFAYCHNTPLRQLDSNGCNGLLADDFYSNPLIKKGEVGGGTGGGGEIITIVGLSWLSQIFSQDTKSQTNNASVQNTSSATTINSEIWYHESERIGLRIRCRTRKEAYEKSKKAGKGKEPDLHAP